MYGYEILRSNIDRSVNFIKPMDDGGFVEARTVQRVADTLIIYLSSMTGCNLSCRFCHLTQTGQTTMKPVDVFGYVEQSLTTLHDVASTSGFEGVKTIHFNFMARGDVLSNPIVYNSFGVIQHKLLDAVKMHVKDVKVLFKLSTIFPKEGPFSEWSSAEKDWVRFTCQNPHSETEFYYSLYSLKPEFRKRWIPKAIDPEIIGDTFRGLDRGLRLHHALIFGQNDTEEDIALIHDWLERFDIHCGMNIIQYNPFNEGSGDSSDLETIQTYATQMQLSHRITHLQIISRVGFDVKASCGMFVEPERY